MKKSLKFDFGQVTVHTNYLLVVVNAGEHLTPAHNTILVNLVDDYFVDKSFVYLTHRKHSYSVDPAIYLETSKIENLAGFGVIAEVPVSKGNAEIEKLFLNKPFEIFNTLEDAVLWAKKILKNEPKGSKQHKRKD